MFYRECERLADRHPDLAPTAERIDTLLGQMTDAEVLRIEDIAGLIGADPHQVSSVLEYLADEKVLSRETMVECGYCGMVVAREDYEAQMEEDGEYSCSECERPVTPGSARPCTTYRRGEAWKVATPPPSMVRERAATYAVGGNVQGDGDGESEHGGCVPTFRRNGEHWQIWFDGKTTTLRDGVGPRHVALLLARPGQRMHAMDMLLADAHRSGRGASVVSPSQVGDADEVGLSIRRTPATSGGRTVDRKVVPSCRARLERIDGEIAAAESAGNPALIAELKEEAEKINRYIGSVIDLRGNPRPTADDDERARTTVMKAIKRTTKRLKERHPALALHLMKHVETGFTCVYNPEPLVTWVTE